MCRPPEAVPHLSKPLDSQLGEAVEDILRYADELARATRRSGAQSGCCAAGWLQRRLTHSSAACRLGVRHRQAAAAC